MSTKQKPVISRRHFLVIAGSVATAAWLAPQNLFALDDGLVPASRKSAINADIAIQSLRGNVSVLIGSGGNIAVLPGRDGTLLIDSGFAASQPKITKALATVSPGPVGHLINTHWHYDHTDGNEWLHSAGAVILAHENTRKHLSVATRVEDWDFTFPPSPAGALPTDVFSTSREIQINGATLALKYYGPAHTDGDISIYFTEADVFHTGDTWWNGHFPFIDYSTGGSIDAMISAADSNLAAVTDKTIIIPGHGPVGNKPQLADYRDMLVTIRDRVANLKKQGKSRDEIAAAKPTSEYDSKWGGFFISGDFFARLVYEGV